MATSTKTAIKLYLKLDNGGSYTYSDVKLDATDEGLFNLCNGISVMQIPKPKTVNKIEEFNF